MAFYDTPKPMSSINAKMPAEMDRIIAKALEKVATSAARRRLNCARISSG